jgi:predicted DNA-binding protein
MSAKDARIGLRLPEELKNQIVALCEKEDIPVAQWIRDAIKEKLKEDK